MVTDEGLERSAKILAKGLHDLGESICWSSGFAVIVSFLFFIGNYVVN